MLNRAELIGHLGQDPELSQLQGGTAKCYFSLATTEYFKDRHGQKAERTEWHQIVCWRDVATNAAKVLRKGGKCYVEGKIQTKKWTDGQGVEKHATEIVCEKFVWLERKQAEAETGAGN